MSSQESVESAAEEYGYFDTDAIVCQRVNCDGGTATWYIARGGTRGGIGSIKCTNCHQTLAQIDIPRTYLASNSGRGNDA